MVVGECVQYCRIHRQRVDAPGPRTGQCLGGEAEHRGVIPSPQGHLGQFKSQHYRFPTVQLWQRDQHRCHQVRGPVMLAQQVVYLPHQGRQPGVTGWVVGRWQRPSVTKRLDRID
jgi:hypothetical protein